MLQFDDAQRYQALIARDARFDGVFFVGVTSTGVYCRPVCRAPRPRADRCRYFASAAAAERQGFRPCLRCRPELTPGGGVGSGDRAVGLAHDGAARRLARVAAGHITAGALDRESVAGLAARLGVSARRLRRALERELGATPVELAQTRRLLVAKQLLSETDLPITRVALASGFKSVRRLNALMRERYRLSLGELRRGVRRSERHDHDVPPDTLRLSLAYRPPYDWAALLAFLSARATPGVEVVTAGAGGRYWRSALLHGRRGYVAVGPAVSRGRASGPGAHALEVELSTDLLPVLLPLLARLRRLLDLDAEPHSIGAHLEASPALRPYIARRPGLRVPGAIDGFELAVRAVLGQQVSVRGATTLAGRLASLLADPLPHAVVSAGALPAGLTRLPVSAERLADASPELVAGIGLPRARAQCIIALARATACGGLPELESDVAGGDPEDFKRRFTALPGIGAWTAEYVTMRALSWPDAFPEGDIALRRALGRLSPARLRDAAEPWRPWRAYAALHLWTGLGERRSSAGA